MLTVIICSLVGAAVALVYEANSPKGKINLPDTALGFFIGALSGLLLTVTFSVFASAPTVREEHSNPLYAGFSENGGEEYFKLQFGTIYLWQSENYVDSVPASNATIIRGNYNPTLVVISYSCKYKINFVHCYLPDESYFLYLPNR